jgi:glycosyltransferase 2 family protein
VPRWLAVTLRIVGTAGGLGWVAWHVDLDDAGAMLARIPLPTFALATALVAANVVVGAYRWRAVLRAYGAVNIPPVARLVGLYFVAFFYNTYVPGAVAGDVARGVVTDGAFRRGNTTAALAVVLVERALGLVALFALLATGLALTGDRIAETSGLWWWTALGAVGACALILALPAARRLARWCPRPLRRIAERLPALRSLPQFALAVALSLGTQALIALAGWVLLAAVGPIDLASSLLVVPLAAATAFLPITVGGAGAREAVYVALCGRLFGLPEGAALAAALGLWLSHLLVGAAGGLGQLARPKKLDLDSPE